MRSFKFYCAACFVITLVMNGYSQINKSSPKFEAYLFAYFEGTGPSELQEQIRFAISDDAINWHALNGNKPVLNSSKISNTGGVRDPHILRGENSDFYMVATDMFTRKNGWDTNPGIVLLYSENLIDWGSSAINLEERYPKKFKNVKWVWAPQTIYDFEEKKYLVYFTVRFHHNLKLDFYSAYANEDFTGFESAPKLMYSAKDGAIDGDIILNDGVYHLFYKGNTKNEEGEEFENGIKQATSTSLKGSWKEHFNYLDAYANKNTVVEGSSVFKLIGKEEYILMYDLYSSGRYEFQRSTDLYNFSKKTEEFTKNFHPRHGSVISITNEEIQRLNNQWRGVPASILK